MTLLEACILFAAILGVLASKVASPTRNARRIAALLASVTGILMLWYVATDQWRWQMWPGLVLAVISIILATSYIRRPISTDRSALTTDVPLPSKPLFRHHLKRWAANISLLSLAALAILLLYIFPLTILPAPTGKFAVGTTWFPLEDKDRAEAFSADPADRRKLEIVTWYPAADQRKPVAKIWGNPGLIGRELGASLGLPEFFFSHLRHVSSHAHKNATPLKSGRFPTLVFSHGYGSFAAQSSALFEDLASHGYIVVAISHPHEASIAHLSNGRLVKFDKNRVEAFAADYQKSSQTLEMASKSSDPAVVEARLREAFGKMPSVQQSVDIWAKDIEFVHNMLRNENASIPHRGLADAIDPERLGVMGMSFGGGAGTEMCARSRSCAVLVSLDGSPASVSGLSGIPNPTLFMVSDNDTQRKSNLPYFRRAATGSQYVVIQGSSHFDYSDLSLISPLFKWLGIVGPVEAETATSATRLTVRNFLDRRLHQRGSSVALPIASTTILYER